MDSRCVCRYWGDRSDSAAQTESLRNAALLRKTASRLRVSVQRGVIVGSVRPQRSKLKRLNRRAALHVFPLCITVTPRRIDGLCAQQNTDLASATLHGHTQPRVGARNARDSWLMHAISAATWIQVVQHSAAATYDVDIGRLRKRNIECEHLTRHKRLTGRQRRRISAIIRKQDLRCARKSSALIGRWSHTGCAQGQREHSK